MKFFKKYVDKPTIQGNIKTFVVKLVEYLESINASNRIFEVKIYTAHLKFNCLKLYVDPSKTHEINTFEFLYQFFLKQNNIVCTEAIYIKHIEDKSHKFLNIEKYFSDLSCLFKTREKFFLKYKDSYVFICIPEFYISKLRTPEMSPL